MVQLVAGDNTVHVAPPGDAVIVYEEGVPPDDGGVTVTIALLSPGTAVGAPGVPGTAIVHWAVKVLLAVTLVIDVPAS